MLLSSFVYLDGNEGQKTDTLGIKKRTDKYLALRKIDIDSSSLSERKVSLQLKLFIKSIILREYSALAFGKKKNR